MDTPLTRLTALIPAWWWTGIIATQVAPTAGVVGGVNLFEYGIGIGMALLIAALWQQDRKSRVAQQKAADARYGAVVEQIKSMVQENTAAMTKLSEGLAGKISNCPISADPVMRGWMRAWAEHSAAQTQTHSSMRQDES